VYTPVAPFPGDYNDDSIVSQADLDLVLLNWGADGSVPPDDWISDLPSGQIDQAELDKVLLNWGQSQESAPAAQIPEATTLQLAAVIAGAVVARAVRKPVGGNKGRRCA
jgi:hypothetical protein